MIFRFENIIKNSWTNMNMFVTLLRLRKRFRVSRTWGELLKTLWANTSFGLHLITWHGFCSPTIKAAFVFRRNFSLWAFKSSNWNVNGNSLMEAKVFIKFVPRHRNASDFCYIKLNEPNYGRQRAKRVQLQFKCFNKHSGAFISERTSIAIIKITFNIHFLGCLSTSSTERSRT